MKKLTRNEMKKLSRKEMKNVKGGDAPVDPVDCAGPCNLPQALCNSLKGCSLGAGIYNWRCCTP